MSCEACPLENRCRTSDAIEKNELYAGLEADQERAAQWETEYQERLRVVQGTVYSGRDVIDALEKRTHDVLLRNAELLRSVGLDDDGPELVDLRIERTKRIRRLERALCQGPIITRTFPIIGKVVSITCGSQLRLDNLSEE